MSPVTTLANTAWFLHAAWRSRSWRDAISNVEGAQGDLLKKIVRENETTFFGRQHGFEKIDSVATFQKLVPIRRYDEFAPYIDRIARGDRMILTSSDVLRFGVSSGSTSASKLVPYTSRLTEDFREGFAPWAYTLMRSNPGIMTGKAYWSMTPVGAREKYSSSGIPVGFDDDESYFDVFTRSVLRHTMAAPQELVRIQEMDVFRYATLRFLLQEGSLSWISIWNPTFLTLLIRNLKEWLPRLSSDIHSGALSAALGVPPDVDARIRSRLIASPRRARELEAIRSADPEFICEALWPNLRLISCWADGAAGSALDELRCYFPKVAIEPKGLLATEAFVSFPFRAPLSALSIMSHFFEFEDARDGRLHLAHELEVGKVYSVIVTTNGGLYRYRLGDLVQIHGHEKECPLMRFVGREDKVVDVFGEKLNERFVAETVDRALRKLSLEPRFKMMAPDRQGGTVAYTLFVGLCEHRPIALKAVRSEIESSLRENCHYEYARRLGQLSPSRVYLISEDANPTDIYLSTCVALGQRLGDIKPVSLHAHQAWSQAFPGKFIE